MPVKRTLGLGGPAIALTAGALLLFVILSVLQAPAGRFVDWLVGIASFWWLLVIVTVPWNIHFEAREVIADAQDSASKGIAVREEQVAYARRWVPRALAIAVLLHLASAAALYWIAAARISPVGYVSAGAALLLTGLRPAVRAYGYVAGRLAAIRHELRYPREDVGKLRTDVGRLAARVEALEKTSDPQLPGSHAAHVAASLEEARHDLRQLRAAVEQLRRDEQVEHERLARDAQRAVAQITTDGQVLDHVREIIRFFKQA
jgi:hypothetical protein